MAYFGHFYLDKEKDILIRLYLRDGKMTYRLETPNHGTGNLITNFAALAGLELRYDNAGLKIIEGEIPCYRDGANRKLWILRFAGTKVANIYPDGTIERKAYIPAIAKTLMSQTKDYRLGVGKTLVKTYILDDCKFHTDLHTHMNANLSPDILMALGIQHQIRYPLYYVKKLSLSLTDEQRHTLGVRRSSTAVRIQRENDALPPEKRLQGKYLTRRIDDNTFINFADLILNNIPGAQENISRIRASLAVMKDGQAVFTNLEKVYLYRYVFTKGVSCREKLPLRSIGQIPSKDIVSALEQMQRDRQDPAFRHNSLFQDELLWIARTYAANGISYAEISDTTLVKPDKAPEMLGKVHAVMPAVTARTGVTLRFLAAFRRTPLTIVKDQIPEGNYFQENLRALDAVAVDPYVAGSDFVGEEMNDIRDLEPVIREIVRIASGTHGFVVRVHAGENDGLPDNVANAIRCVEKALQPGQAFPHMRIGHGLYTTNLNTRRGQALMKKMRDFHIVLEFQITSNVRLNNLSNLDNHPLKTYLAGGIRCVQGTDGGALYGTDSIDEQLSLEKMLELTPEEMRKMRRAEDVILQKSLDDFAAKQEAFTGSFREVSLLSYVPATETEVRRDAVTEFYRLRMREESGKYSDVFAGGVRFDSAASFADRISELPEDKVPVVLAGGSFNNDRHETRLHPDMTEILDDLLKRDRPKNLFFVIGGQLSGYERYLYEENQKRPPEKRFEIYSFVPSSVTEKQREMLRAADLKIRVSIEPNSMGVYKSIAYEIFKRRDSIVLAFDGNSAAANLIQDAKNSKYRSRIFISRHSRKLMTKAASLEGYVTLIGGSGTRKKDVDEVLQYIQLYRFQA